MLYLSFAGLLVGLLVFILLCFKKVNTILAAVVSVSIMLLASLPLLRESGLGFYQMLITGAKEQGFSSYMDGVGGFLKNYLLLFMLSALYGKVMEDSGAVRRLTLSLTKLIKKRKSFTPPACCLCFTPSSATAAFPASSWCLPWWRWDGSCFPSATCPGGSTATAPWAT